MIMMLAGLMLASSRLTKYLSRNGEISISQDQINRIDGFLKVGSNSLVFRKNLKEIMKVNNNYGLIKGTNGNLKIKIFKHEFGQFLRYTEVHRPEVSNIHMQPFAAKKKKIVEDNFMQMPENYLTRNVFVRM